MNSKQKYTFTYILQPQFRSYIPSWKDILIHTVYPKKGTSIVCFVSGSNYVPLFGRQRMPKRLAMMVFIALGENPSTTCQARMP